MRLLLAVATTATILSASLTTVIAQTDQRDIRARVEAEFRRAMSRLAYGESGALYRSAANISRQAWSEGKFSEMLDRRRSGPAAGDAYQITEIRIVSDRVVIVHARVRIHIQRGSLIDREDFMAFSFHYEDGDWRPDLSPFIGIVSW